MLHWRSRYPLATVAAAALILVGCASLRLMKQAPAQPAPAASGLRIAHDEPAGTLSVYRPASAEPVLVQNAKPGVRPYLHPIASPDGQGVLTEYRPAHHPHQTGLYWGFTRVNGRDYFHNGQ